MTTVSILLLGLLPAAWVVWAGQTVRTPVAGPEAARRRHLLLSGGLTLSLVVPLIVFFSSLPGVAPAQFLIFLLVVLTPALCGGLAILVLESFAHLGVLSTRWIGLVAIPLTALVLGLAVPIAIIVPFPGILVCDALLIAVLWQLWDWMGPRYPVLYVIQIILLAISIRAEDFHNPALETPTWLATLTQITVYLIPAAAMVLAARLLLPDQSSHAPKEWRRFLLGALLCVPLVALASYQLMLAAIWDVATDGLGGMLLLVQVSVAAMASALVLAWSAPGRHKFVALAFAVIIPVLMLRAQDIGTYGPAGQWGMMPAFVTEQRAETLSRAVVRYYARNRAYPRTLGDLVPFDLLYVPTPLIIPGQTWCYEGGREYFRLGYVYRQYFSSPKSVRIHASAGEPPTATIQCP